ncbi:uncharacterized protein [Watersipora subatra]|uniref:uncharacterized protein n=1 Tax=Watersipora subatra TaxID=2589382 RepID=UPI00355C953E
MGSAIYKDNESKKADGEMAYETIARGFSYRRCSRAENQKPLTRSTSVRRSSRYTNGSLPKHRKPLKRSGSRRSLRGKDKGTGFVLSDLKVQVDGKVAILVPRNSAMKRKRMSSIKAKLTFSSKTAQKTESTEPSKAKSIVNKTSASEEVHQKPKMSPIFGLRDRSRKDDIKPIDAGDKNNDKTQSKKPNSIKRSFSKLRSKSECRKGDLKWNDNNNNNYMNMNVNRTGNMALNIEKERLRRLGSDGDVSRRNNLRKENFTLQKSSSYGDYQPAQKFAADIQTARKKMLGKEESVKRLNLSMTRLSVSSTSTDSV